MAQGQDPGGTEPTNSEYSHPHRPCVGSQSMLPMWAYEEGGLAYGEPCPAGQCCFGVVPPGQSNHPPQATEEDQYDDVPPLPFIPRTRVEEAEAAERAHTERVATYHKLARAWHEAATELEREDGPRAEAACAAAQAEAAILGDRISDAVDVEFGRPLRPRFVPKRHSFMQHLPRMELAKAYRGLACAWLAAVTELEWR